MKESTKIFRLCGRVFVTALATRLAWLAEEPTPPDPAPTPTPPDPRPEPIPPCPPPDPEPDPEPPDPEPPTPVERVKGFLLVCDVERVFSQGGAGFWVVTSADLDAHSVSGIDDLARLVERISKPDRACVVFNVPPESPYRDLVEDLTLICGGVVA